VLGCVQSVLTLFLASIVEMRIRGEIYRIKANANVELVIKLIQIKHTLSTMLQITFTQKDLIE
jgi:hypothetical protein